MDTAVVAGWSEFVTAVAATAGALVGLVFVSLSINLARILEQPGIASRGAETIVLLAAALTEALVALVPHVSVAHLGAWLLVVALPAWLVPASLQVRNMLTGNYYRRSLGFLRIGLHQLATVPAVVAAVLLLRLDAAGMDWFAFGAIASMLVAIFSAWVLLVEIMR